MEPDLNKLLQEESSAMENLNQAFIRFSLARNNVTRRLKEIRDNQPTLFSQDKDH